MTRSIDVSARFRNLRRICGTPQTVLDESLSLSCVARSFTFPVPIQSSSTADAPVPVAVRWYGSIAFRPSVEYLAWCS